MKKELPSPDSQTHRERGTGRDTREKIAGKGKGEVVVTLSVLSAQSLTSLSPAFSIASSLVFSISLRFFSLVSL